MVRMSRTIRAQLPGTAFHITARTQGHEPWFVPQLRAPIEQIIVEGVTSSDAWLMSHVVMPNHFHIVLRQGAWPLGQVMQPILRRIALHVQHAHDIEGHVFERRFRSIPCANADQLRRCIVYTHNNPRRKGLCDDLSDYRWSSHFRYVTEPTGDISRIELVTALRLFADSPPQSKRELRNNYIRYVQWRLAKDDCDVRGEPFCAREPSTIDGDKIFAEKFTGLPLSPRVPLKDLRDKAMELLAEIHGECEMSRLRRRTSKRAVVEVRRQLIAALLQCGYRRGSIADFFNISDTTVSVVATAMRYHPPLQNGKRERGPIK